MVQIKDGTNQYHPTKTLTGPFFPDFHTLVTWEQNSLLSEDYQGLRALRSTMWETVASPTKPLGLYDHQSHLQN